MVSGSIKMRKVIILIDGWSILRQITNIILIPLEI